MPSASHDTRLGIDSLIAQREWSRAAAALSSLKNEAANASFLISRYEQISEHLELVSARIAILRSFTVEPMVPMLRALGYASGLDLAIRVGDFNAFNQELLDDASWLYKFQPHVVLLAALTSEVSPSLWTPDSTGSDVENLAICEQVIESYTRLVEAFRRNSSAYLLIHSLEQPIYPSDGLIDLQRGGGQTATINLINERLRAYCQRTRGVFLFDYARLVSSFGGFGWRDEARWHSVRLPITPRHLPQLAAEWVRYLHPLLGKTAKVAAIDLDNTIWGGVIAEDGVAGVKLGHEYPGSAFLAIQRALLDLKKRGILLAICSKNNLDDAMEMFSTHPEMLLKRDHFSAVRINWKEKSDNLRDIAVELGIGIDSVALIDDNPVERQQVRETLPTAYVVDLPSSFVDFASTIRRFPAFERLELSAEDALRENHYVARHRVIQLETTASSKEEFLASLEQIAYIAKVSELTLARAAQLTQKTNQFNLTTKRYTQDEIARILQADGWNVLTMRIADRYIDNGIVGLAITRDAGGVRSIDTFLLSCRVIGRGAETALLSDIVAGARSAGLQYVEGCFVPTKKNAPARDFYSAHGFQEITSASDVSKWRLKLTDDSVPWPEWIRRGEDEKEV